MKILVDRYKSDEEATLSRVSVVMEKDDAAADDMVGEGAVVYSIYGLEDEFREVKVPGETRIPAGTYRVTLRREGGFHERYSRDRRVRDIHKGMLWVRDVPGFEYILIHIGNFESDTDGCLLLGVTCDERLMCVWQSAPAYRTFYNLVAAAAESGQLTIEYQDNDRG